jgi:hypothetical protein
VRFVNIPVSPIFSLEIGIDWSVTDGPERSREEPYDLVIFLGGTNDLAYARAPETIWGDVKGVLKLPLENGARVVVMTVPECGVRSAGLDGRRGELNGFIRGVVGERDDV